MNLQWHVPPSNGGQMVEVSYASSVDNQCYFRLVHDLATKMRYYWKLNFDSAKGAFEPWNDIVPEGKWEYYSQRRED